MRYYVAFISAILLSLLYSLPLSSHSRSAMFFEANSKCIVDKKDKEIQKECNKTTKRLKAEGWSVYGNTKSLEDALHIYYEEIEKAGTDVQTLISSAEAKNTNQALTKAQHHLKAQYASMMESKINGETNIQMENETYDFTTKSKIEFDSTYESNINYKLKNLKPNLIITRIKPNGDVEIQMFLIVK